MQVARSSRSRTRLVCRSGTTEAGKALPQRSLVCALLPFVPTDEPCAAQGHGFIHPCYDPRALFSFLTMPSFVSHDPLPVEQTVDRLVDLAGGKRVSEIVGHSPGFQNADYVFASSEIVVELKELTTDWPKRKDFQERIGAMWAGFVREGRLSDAHLSGSEEIPRDVQRQFLDLLRKPVKRVLEKANRQIRETNARLGYENGQGVLLLVVDGVLTVAPMLLMSLVCKILSHGYSSIKCLVLMTVNEYVEIPGDDYARLLWVPAYQDDDAVDLSNFVNQLGRQWFDFLEGEIGGFDDRWVGEEEPRLAGASFIRRV